MSCSGDNLKSNCTQPAYFMGLPFATVRLRSASISSEISLTYKSGNVLARKCPEIIETWAPVSQSASVASPLSIQFTVHLFPTRPTSFERCFGIR